MEKVKDSMTRKIVTVHWNTPLTQASRLMSEREIRHLPVTDSEGRVIGILSEHDVLRALNPVRPGFEDGLLVGDFMNWPALSVRDTLPLDQVAEGMIAEKISAYLVTGKNNDVVGIITSEDLLSFFVTSWRQGPDSSWAEIPYTPVVREALRTIESLGI